VTDGEEFPRSADPSQIPIAPPPVNTLYALPMGICGGQRVVARGRPVVTQCEHPNG
jgi:hypothetical protein